MYANDSTLSNSNADMRCIWDRFTAYHRDIYLTHNQMLLPDPLVEEYSETDDYFMEQDLLIQKRVNEQIRTYSVPGPFGRYYSIYCQGLPFECLFFDARQQLDYTVRELACERKKQEFIAELDPAAYDDFNIFEGYCKAQSAIREYKQLVN